MESEEPSSQLRGREEHDSASQRGNRAANTRKLSLTDHMVRRAILSPYGPIVEVQTGQKYNLRNWLTNSGESVSRKMNDGRRRRGST